MQVSENLQPADEIAFTLSMVLVSVTGLSGYTSALLSVAPGLRRLNQIFFYQIMENIAKLNNGVKRGDAFKASVLETEFSVPLQRQVETRMLH